MYYFAYGSNMDFDHIRHFIPDNKIEIVGPAYVENFIFRYRNVNINNLRSGVANIEQRRNSKTYGVIYKINNDAELKNLDKKEGHKSLESSDNVYNKIEIECVLCDSVAKTQCFTYQMSDIVKLEEKKPRISYLNYLKNGNATHKLPHEHLKRIHYLSLV